MIITIKVVTRDDFTKTVAFKQKLESVGFI